MSALRIDELEVRLSRRPVLRKVSMTAEAGEVVGLIGPNGAGKTTLLRAAAGLLPLSTGQIRLFGRALGDWSQAERARALAYLPQARGAVWRITVADLVRLGRLPHRAGWWQGPTAEDQTAVTEALEACDLSALAERPVTELSGGELARAGLARVVATRPSLLLADEPTAGLDPAHCLDVMRLFRRLASEGLAVVTTLHDLNLAGRFCDRLLLLESGRGLAEGSPETVLTPERLRDAYRVEVARATVAGESLVVPLRRADESPREALP